MSARTILITGAASGIGRAAALALAAKGHRLGLIDISASGLEETAIECAQAAALVTCCCDVSDENAINDAIAHALNALGRPDILVASAGIARYGPFAELTTIDWQSQFAVNVMGTIHPIRAVLPQMVAAGQGLVIAVGSRRGLEPKSTTSAYSASKGALHAAMRALQAEYGPKGVDFSYLAPGGTQTGLASPKDERFMSAETVGTAIAFMCESYPAGWVRQLEILPRGLD